MDSARAGAPTGPGHPGSLPDRMRADLVPALKAGDRLVTGVLRTALAALANAEALPVEAAPDPRVVPLVGVLGDVPRRRLTDADHRRVLEAEVADRQDTADQLTAAGRPADAAVLHEQIAVLRRYLD